VFAFRKIAVVITRLITFQVG